MTNRRASLTFAAALMLVLAAGCHKKTPPPPPPPPPAEAPPPAKPTIGYFTAEPSTINSGQPSSLRWSVTDANNVQIDGIGPVSPSGRRAVYPTSTTTYHLIATGPGGGSSDASATVTVSAPPAPEPITRPTSESPAEMLARQVQDIHFDYDKSDIRPQDQSILQADATALKSIFVLDPNFTATVEGHCDERGSAEYNLGLGDRRASATKDALVGLGVPGDKLRTISYGKERPLCTDASEDCYQRNRRAHFSATQ
ncbi:MAG: OmpA family protein [Bryobacteraceae bacterium]